MANEEARAKLNKELDKLRFPVHVVPVWQPAGHAPYLFAVPEKTYLTLEEGDKVLCSTKHGEQDGVCASADLWLNREELKALVYACGATLPLKPLVGKYAIIRFEDEMEKRGMTAEEIIAKCNCEFRHYCKGGEQ